jgi:nitrate/nitrite transport system ATP-binding protein
MTSAVRPLEITSLTKVFDTPTGPMTVVKDFDIRIQPGEFVALLGHSGCGKSTVLSIIAGLQQSTFGGIVLDGREVTEPGLERAFVFQSPSLLPWMSALDNVALAAAQAHPKLTPIQHRELAAKYLDLVGIAEFAKQLPGELSQGTQQRVAIARALSQEPRFLLLDEPFGMLDSLTRFELQDLVLSLWEKDRKTVVMVTHDIDEALYLCDRIILMTDGPEARVGLDLHVDIPRPRDRRSTTKHATYLKLRSTIIEFLESHSKQFSTEAH